MVEWIFTGLLSIRIPEEMAACVGPTAYPKERRRSQTA
jgi:hypothetical protein